MYYYIEGLALGVCRVYMPLFCSLTSRKITTIFAQGGGVQGCTGCAFSEKIDLNVLDKNQKHAILCV